MVYVKEITFSGWEHAKSPIKLISPKVIQQTAQSHYLDCEITHEWEIWKGFLFKLLAPLLCIIIFVWSKEGHCNDNEGITTCADPLWCDMSSGFNSLLLFVQTKVRWWDLEGEISVRRRLSWVSLTPPGIAHRALLKVQDYIIEIACVEGKGAVGWRALEKSKREKRIINCLHWLGSTCFWVTYHLSDSGFLIF